MTLWHENMIDIKGITTTTITITITITTTTITTTTTMMNRSKTTGMSVLLIWNLMTMTLIVRYIIITMAGVATDDVMYEQ
jgi:hypothetical protein